MNNQVKTQIRKWLPDAVCVLLFVAISFAYFFPADIEGRILYRHDSSAGRGSGQELSEYYQRTGETTRWTGSLFGGMPTYQMAPAYKSLKPLDAVRDAWHLWLPDYVWYLFVYLLGFYLLLRAMGLKPPLSAAGAIMWAFSSYFLIIIAAGHYWKVMALAYLPPMLAGMTLAYRGRYLKGLAVSALFTALEIQANHIQMTYYFLIVIIAMAAAWLADSILAAVRRKKNKGKQIAGPDVAIKRFHFLKATGAFAGGVLIGVLINISNLYHTWEYSKETMRGGSELAVSASEGQKQTGLDRDYITQWSYGIGETWTLLVPNAKGGASVPLSSNPTAMSHANNTYAGIYQQIGQYWGEQPGTSGPVYVGAFVVMLFILGLFIVKGPMKWALLLATILSVLLSWGRNFMGLTDLFIDYVPMYSKFRTVASILVVAEFTMPLLAIMALKKIFDDRDFLKGKMKYLYISFALTGGICLLFALAPGFFFHSFVSSSEMSALSQWPQEHLTPLLNNLTEMRKAIFTADCWRSLWVIIIGTGILLLFRAGTLKKSYAVGGILLLCIIDLWAVDKRYLYDSMFVDAGVKTQPVRMTQSEEAILRDEEKGFRVLNLSTNTFNENETSYYLRSIGGYHPAKLRRYQDLIDTYLYKEMRNVMPAVAESRADLEAVSGDSLFPVLNMLNAKYFILPLQGGQTAPIENPWAKGAAWMVDKVEYVDGANEEIGLLGERDLSRVAIADKSQEEAIGQSTVQDSLAKAVMTDYEPNRISYDVSSETGGVLVFSEIYYPGWTATVDGKDAPVGRANYLLRAVNLEPGSHEVVLSFFPRSVKITESIAWTAYLLLLGAIGIAIWDGTRKRKLVKPITGTKKEEEMEAKR